MVRDGYVGKRISHAASGSESLSAILSLTSESEDVSQRADSRCVLGSLTCEEKNACICD